MNPKENALRIIRFDNPERIVTEVPQYQTSYTGSNHEGYTGGGHDCGAGTKWVDIWGTEWHKEHEGVMGFPRGNPLAEVGNLKNYKWPDPDDERIYRKIYDMAKNRPGDKTESFLSGSHRDALWEKAYMIVGMENMMTYFYEEPGFVKEVLHRITDFHLGIARHYTNIGVELVGMSDDLGTQSSLILSPRIIREFFVPEYRRLFSFYKERNILIELHSCGKIEDVLEMFIELGVDILNPVQASANDLDKVRTVTHGRMALHGGICSSLVMSGPESRITEEVRKRMLQLGANGGYFCSNDQGLPFPKSHIDAMKDAVEKYGRYPLCT